MNFSRRYRQQDRKRGETGADEGQDEEEPEEDQGRLEDPRQFHGRQDQAVPKAEPDGPHGRRGSLAGAQEFGNVDARTGP